MIPDTASSDGWPKSICRTPRALTEVRKILRPQETLADATVWPDTIKNPLYEDGDTPLFRLAHPAQDTYHYTNVAFQVPRYDLSLPGARTTDILQMMRECARVLRGTSKAFAPREALRMLAHLVGDVHQPLHSGNSFINASGPLRFVLPEGPTGWRSATGGNALVYGPQDRFNLHSYWDTHIVNLAMQQDDVATYAARLVKEVPIAPEWTSPAIPTRGRSDGRTTRSSTRRKHTRTSGSRLTSDRTTPAGCRIAGASNNPPGMTHGREQSSASSSPRAATGWPLF